MTGGSRTVVEDLPETGEREEGAPLSVLLVRRRKLELARTDVLHHLELARADAHREMLQRALAALEQELEKLI